MGEKKSADLTHKSLKRLRRGYTKSPFKDIQAIRGHESSISQRILPEHKAENDKKTIKDGCSSEATNI